MISTLSFSASTNPIKPPAISSGVDCGLSVSLWVRRSGSGSRQRLVDFADANGNKLILETGDQPDSLSIGVLTGTNHQEAIALGVLPQNRWVQVTASFSPIGAVTLLVFGVQVAQGIFPLGVSGALNNWYIAGGAPDCRFVGELSQLTVTVQHSALGNGAIWATYPLSSAVFDHVAQTASGPQQHYRVEDTSGQGHHARNYGGLPTVSYPSPLLSNQTPVLQLDGTGSPLRLSPISGGQRQLTLEAWICPTALTTPQAIFAVGTADDQLLLTAGGDQAQLALVYTHQGQVIRTLLQAVNRLSPGRFFHVAATCNPASNPPTLALYIQGQQVASRTLHPSFPVNEDLSCLLNVRSCIGASLTSVLSIGGQATGVSMFAGQVAEARVWSTAQSASQLADRFLDRVVGNEAGLLAAYRFEHNTSGLVYDLSPGRGLGSLPTGASIAPATALPLLFTTDPNNIYINSRGKLLKESISTPPIPPPKGFPIAGIPSHVITLSVFDATVEPVAPDGSSLAGRNLSVCPDADVTALVDQGDYTAQTTWSSGQTQTLTLPASGKLRLRFVASDLFCPTIRVRVDGMPDGIWSAVRPDSSSLGAMSNITQSNLTQPADGRPSPLPSTMSSSDAAAFAMTVQTIGTVFAPVPRSTGTAPSLANINRLTGPGPAVMNFSLGSVVHSITHGLSTVSGALSSAGGTIVSGLKQAGSEAGSLSSALIDDGSAALSGVTGAIKSAGALIVTDAAGLNDLVKATAMAIARNGSGAITDAIKSADRLAVVTEAVAGELSHTLALIGTTIVNGATVAWRVICSTANDILLATKSFFQRLGADIIKFIDYLAMLFAWGDFLAAADTVYGLVQSQIFPQISTAIDGLAQQKSKLTASLTIPSSYADKSLAQISGININPVAQALEELSYVTELVHKLFGSANLNLGSLVDPSAAISGLTSQIDLSALSGLSVATGPNSALQSPQALFNTPLQALVDSITGGNNGVSLVDFILDNFTGLGKAGLAVGQSMLTAHLSIPGLTSLIENTILGGRSLNLLRLISLLAAIPAVLADKITSATQASSFSSTSDWDRFAPWLNFALGVAFVGITFVQCGLETVAAVREKAAKDSQTEANKESRKASEIPIACCDFLVGLLSAMRGAIAVSMNVGLPVEAQVLLDAGGALDFFSAVWTSAVGAIVLYDAWHPDFSFFTMRGIAKCANVVVQLGCGVVNMLISVAVVAGGALQTDLDKAQFGLVAGQFVFFPITMMVKGIGSIAQDNEALKSAAIGLSVLTAAIDMGAAAVDAAQGAGA